MFSDLSDSKRFLFLLPFFMSMQQCDASIHVSRLTFRVCCVQVVEEKMKRLQNSPSLMMPTPSDRLLRKMKWLEDTSDEVANRITEIAVLKHYGEGETIVQEGDESDGMYLVVSGLVRVPFLSPSVSDFVRKFVNVRLGNGGIRFFQGQIPDDDCCLSHFRQRHRRSRFFDWSTTKCVGRM